MRLMVCAVGKLRTGPEAALVKDYSDRIAAAGRSLGFPQFDIKEVEAPRGLKGAKRQNAEASLLIDAAPDTGIRVILDERGKDLSSATLAKKLGQWRDDGAANTSFFIGGADGHGDELLNSADLKIAFGSATWPHMLVRAMLCEQLYRAMTILSGHPYHRA